MIDLVTDLAAAYRLTRLVTADSITAPIRDGIVEAAYVRAGSAEEVRPYVEQVGWTEVAISDPHPPRLAELVTCRWCAGMWISLGVVAARRLVPSLWAPLGTALALSAGATLLAGLEDD